MPSDLKRSRHKSQDKTDKKEKGYRCTCEKHCHGGKPVSQRTFQRHKPHRKALYSEPVSDGEISESDTSSESASDSDESDSDTNTSSSSTSSAFKRRRLDSDLPSDPTDDFLIQNDFRDDGEDQSASHNNGGRISPTIPGSDRIDPGSLADNRAHSPTPSESDSDDSNSDSETDSNTGADPSLTTPVKVQELQTALDFIEAVKNASLDNGDLDEDALDRLRNPSHEPLDVSDPAELYSLSLFLATTHGSEEQYNALRDAYLQRHPENEVLTLAKIKRKVAEWSGVVPILSHMCRDSCMAFTGPYADLDACKICKQPRFFPDGSAHTFYTIPLGPQIQALFRNPESAKKMHYRREVTAEILASLDLDGNIDIPVYKDIFHGSDYLEAVMRGDIKDTDVVVIGSIDGAQLYRNKHSDCWISIWIIGEQCPQSRFKVRAILSDSIFPGPNKPKHLDSFQFTSVHHIAALQKEGLRVWDAHDHKEVISRPFLLMETADAPGMTGLNGLVGHHGFYGCRLYCPLKGRHKDGKSHYYPVMQRPNNYAVPGCSHPDVRLEDLEQPSEELYLNNLQTLLASRNETDYKEQRKKTGIVKPSLFSGLGRKHRLGIPGLFPGDIMHWACLNWTDLILSLFRGTMRCEAPDQKDSWDWAVLTGDVWKKHGQAVADATPYFPGSFDRTPRNPAEKISSGYKAWEFLLYVIGLGPALFIDIIPEKYWSHFCKGVSVIRSFQQYEISAPQVVAAHERGLEYVDEFETLYYQRMESRIHLVRQSVHNMSHLGPETIRVGPAPLFAQWTIERTIGNLGQEIKSHSKPYANLSERGVRRCQVNALKALIPDLDHAEKKGLPRGSVDLGDGFVLLRARDEFKHRLDGDAGRVIREYLEKEKGKIRGSLAVVRWARIRLPNGQIARSAWKEKRKELHKVRMARNVKILRDRKYEIAEVQFYFLASIRGETQALAVVDFYSDPCPDLLSRSFHTIWSSTSGQGSALRVIPAKLSLSVVAMVPHAVKGDARFFLVEKPGLELIGLAGYEEDDDEDDVPSQ